MRRALGELLFREEPEAVVECLRVGAISADRRGQAAGDLGDGLGLRDVEPRDQRTVEKGASQSCPAVLSPGSFAIHVHAIAACKILPAADRFRRQPVCPVRRATTKVDPLAALRLG